MARCSARRLLPTPAVLAAALAAPLLVGLAAPDAPAQTGPWQDGEIILLDPLVGGGGAYELLRVDPATGDAEQLTPAKYWGGWAGGMVFDPYRGGVVACMSQEPDAYWNYKPWLVGADGSLTALPGLDAVSLKAMASIGDGRIYFQRRNPASSQIEYYDAGNQLHVLMDASGSAPFELDIEHALYDAAGNALIATRTVWWSGPGCSATESSVYRIPLSPDGSQVAGPVGCTTLPGVSGNIMSLDHYPGGLMFLVLAGTNDEEKLWLVDPLGPSVGYWASSDHYDLNGGLYSQRIGQAIVFEDYANELRSYGAGSSGDGVLLPVDMPIGDGTSGNSPADWLFDIDLLGPDCDGFHVQYGAGLAGEGGLLPVLAATGCPDLGQTFSMIVDDVVGGTSGILFFDLAQGAIPFKGGTFLLGNATLQVPLSPGGTPGVAGAGDLAFPLQLGDPVFVGLDLYWQAGFLDGAAVLGVSLTNGLRIQAG